MNKLILIILICMCSPGTEAHKMGLQDVSAHAAAPVPEPMDLFNPFLFCRN